MRLWRGFRNRNWTGFPGTNRDISDVGLNVKAMTAQGLF